jgi:hypothetical protein
MILIVRGIVWYGFYLFLLLLPLLTAALSNPERAWCLRTKRGIIDLGRESRRFL